MPQTFTDHTTHNHPTAPFLSFREIAPALLFTASAMNAADKISQTNLPLLIAGEKGLGQPYLSQLVHEAGFTKGQSFLELHLRPNREQENLDTLYALLLADLPGQAFRGTLHIHGLENASFRLQSALLHMLDEQRLVPDRNQFRFEGRISASIHKTLDEIASQDVILHELLYKLSIAPIQLKPLRERRNDIPLIADTFIKACAQRLPVSSKQFSDDAIKCLQEHSWPGNLPELESVIYRSILFSSAPNLERQNILFSPTLPKLLSAETLPAQSSAVVSMPQEHATASAQTAPLELSIAHLVAELSHEIKNPLVAIKTFIQLVPGHMNDPEFLSEFFSIAEKSTDRIDYLTERMLEFAKLGAPCFDDVSLVSVLQETFKNIEAVGSKLPIAWNPESLAQVPKVRTDFQQLRYSLENILLYIAHNTPDGRPVEIAPAAGAHAPAVAFSYASDKNVQGLAFHNDKGDRINDLNGLDLFLAQQVLQKNLISCTKHHAHGNTVITVQLCRI
jgi:hypothetical protein